MSTLEELKSVACKAIDESSECLLKVNKEIYDNPELCFQEKHAHEILTQFLEKCGFDVEKTFELDTAYRCVYGGDQTGPNVAVLCEYDALPEIGHACGHNLIAEAGVAAAVGIKAAMDAATDKRGKLTVLGTPAEEGGGGKVILLRKGVFEGVDAAMMVHPTPVNITHLKNANAVSMVNITYEGKASHAAIAPWEGVNALDAAVTCYQTISNLRQQIKPSWRVHGVIKNGGEKANIIPEKTELEYLIRAPTRSDLRVLKEKVLNCVTAAATATGCKVTYQFGPHEYENVLSNVTFAEAFEKNAVSLGVDYSNPKTFPGASTDMGNVSHVVPSIHPIYAAGPSTVMNHTRDFTKVAGTVEAHHATLTQGKAMAMTALDIFYDNHLLPKMKEEFSQAIARDE